MSFEMFQLDANLTMFACLLAQKFDNLRQTNPFWRTGTRTLICDLSRFSAMEIVRRPTRLSELPVHPQLLRYLAQAGEFFAVVAEGTEYERDVTPRFPGRALSPDYQAVTFHQLELCTRCLVSGRLQPAKLVLDTAASDETRISVLLQGVESLQRLFPEVVQEDITSHGRYLLSIHGDYLRVRNYNMDLIRQNLNIHADENPIGPGDDEIEPEPNPGEDNPSSSDEMIVEGPDDRRIRYQSCTMGEVSDPELWMEWTHMEDNDDDPVVGTDSPVTLTDIFGSDHEIEYDPFDRPPNESVPAPQRDESGESV